jgi:hypothetical protein
MALLVQPLTFLLGGWWRVVPVVAADDEQGPGRDRVVWKDAYL